MLHPEANAKLSVYSLDPQKKIRAMITYPPATGRNFQEMLRVLDGLQLTDPCRVATPTDGRDGDEDLVVRSLHDEAEIEECFPTGVRWITPYLRTTPQPNG